MDDEDDDGEGSPGSMELDEDAEEGAPRYVIRRGS